MVRNNTTLGALCAIIALFILLGPQSACATDDLDLYAFFLVDDTYPVENLEEFEGDIHIPPRGPANQPLPAGTYTLLFDVEFQEEAISVTFEGSLTIQEYNAAGGGVGIGCIQVLGMEDAMVTMDEAEEGVDWDGITILTDPSNDALEDWKERFASGNHIQYCHILNTEIIPLNEAAIVLGDDDPDIDDAQVWVHNCHFNEPVANYNAFLASNSGLYAFQSNYIEGMVNAFAISCNEALDDAADGLEGDLLGQVISHNHITFSVHDGICVNDGWNGTICNNIIENVVMNGILCTNSEEASIVNNTLVNIIAGGNQAAICLDGEWCPNVYNNIIVNCTVGIRGTNDDDIFDYCLLFENDTPFDDCKPANGGNNCIIGNGEDKDPQFVNDVNDDYHLLWTSPAINAGNPNEDYDDPDGSDNDMGAKLVKRVVMLK